MCLHAVFRCAMCTYSRQMYKKDGILFCLHYDKMIFHFGVEKIASQIRIQFVNMSPIWHCVGGVLFEHEIISIEKKSLEITFR